MKKATTSTPAGGREKKPTKQRRRPGVDYNLKVLYPKQPELRGAIFSAQGLKETFEEHLVKAGLFDRTEAGIFIVLPAPRRRNRPGGYCDRPEDLFSELAESLADFFGNQFVTKGSPACKWELRILRAVAYIAAARQLFIEAGAPEKSFDDTVKKLERWNRMLWDKQIDQAEKTPIKNLRLMLFYTYKHLSNLSDQQIFLSVARLLKYLGFEPGTEQAIAQSLKTAMQSQRFFYNTTK
jgi:hypothetical protein